MEEKDLAIIIECDPIFLHNWMSFVSWYSINKNVPDSLVFIKYTQKCNMFNWHNRVGVKKFIKTDRPVIKIIKPSVMAVRSFSGNFDIVSSKTDIYSTFVDYRFGCGSFDLDKWSGSNKAPFENAHKKFSKLDLTINEYAILDIWEQCCFAYRELVGGSI